VNIPSEDEETPPPEEIEMGVEDALGHAFPGTPAQRVEAIKKRIKYLEQQMRGAADADSVAAYKTDLAEARQQLVEWQKLKGGQN
jgi:hypothetical protein